MPPSPSFPNSSDAEHSGYRRVVACFKADQKTDPTVLDRLNIEQMFVLIEGVLPIEACLYYQVLPLFLEGSRLHLGMVSPEDKAASEYVRRIVSYLNYSLVTWEISSGALKASLSAYLRYADQSSALSKKQPSPAARRADRLSRNQAPRKRKVDAANHPTLVVDSPDAIDPSLEELIQASSDSDAKAQNLQPQPFSATEKTSRAKTQQSEANQPKTPQTEPSQSPLMDEAELEATQVISPQEIALEASSAEMANQVIEPVSSEVIAPDIAAASENQLESGSPESIVAEAIASDPIQLEAAEPESSDSILLGTPESEEASESSHASSSLQNNADLPLSLNILEPFSQHRLSKVDGMSPKSLLQKLLVRVLDQGIGRLYFEQRGQSGRILWSENGILQSIVDDLTPLQFRGVISELKGMTHLPLAPAQESCQVDLERVYKDERILLRFRFIPTETGEEATLQVLRGAALRFYQQQQLSRIGRDALTMAQALQSKVGELRDRSRSVREFSDNHAELLPQLTQMLHDIETQINHLNPSPDKSNDRSSDQASS